MAKKRGESGYQIEGDKVARPENVARKVLRLFLIIVIIAALPEAYKGWQELYVNFLEREKPEIVPQDIPPGVGLQPVTIKVLVRDRHAGLEEVVVRSEQRKDVKTLLRRSYTGPKKHEDLLVIDIPGKESGLREGEVEITVKAFDRSFWSNGNTETFTLAVDYKKPKIEVLSTQHNAVVGGAELVFYRVPDDKNVSSGIRVGEGWFFPGFQAKDLDSDFQTHPDVYFAFFAVPLGFDEKNDKLMVYAKDAVGNLSLASIYYHVRKFIPRSKTVRLDEEFLRSKLPELLKSYVETKKGLQGTAPFVNLSLTTTDQLIEGFRLVNVTYREVADQAMQSLFARPKRQRFWHERFLRLENAATQAQFGEQRSYVYENIDAGSSVHEGTDLASQRGAIVRAANGGVVIFAAELGLFGKAIILDHGFGLSTLYGHLSAFQTREGNEVQKGDVIGLTGNSGFAEGDHLHFEVRLHGVPVNPVEWWDGHWIDDHIERKILDVKKTIGVIGAAPIR